MLSLQMTNQADQHLLPVSHAARQPLDRQREGGLTHGEGALRLMGLLPSASTSSSVLQYPGVPVHHIHQPCLIQLHSLHSVITLCIHAPHAAHGTP